MIAIVFKSLAALFSANMRGLLWRSLGLTVLVLLVTGGAATTLLDRLARWSGLVDAFPWIESYFLFVTGFGMFVAGLYLLPAASMVVAGFFLDDVAKIIEERDYSREPEGKPMSTFSALLEGIQFFGVTLGANILALVFLFLPGINIFLYFILNAYLFGREYFYLVAGRHQSTGAITAMYRDHRSRIFSTGFIIAIFVFIPVLNLLTPLFATIMMVHTYKTVARMA